VRKWILAALALLVLLAGLLGFAAVNLSRYLDEHRDWLASQVEGALGRPVRFERIRVSVLGGVSARVEGLRIAGDPSWGTDELLTARDVRVAVRILPALFGRYEIASVVLEDPTIVVVRDQRGLNLESLGRPGAPATPPASPGTPPPAGRPEAPPVAAGRDAGAAAAVRVDAIEIRGGTVRWIDRTTVPPTDVTLARIDVTASEVSLVTAVALRLEAALPGGEKQNLSVEGTIGPLGSPPNVAEAPVDVQVKLDPLDPATLAAAVPSLALPAGAGVTGPLTVSTHVTGTAATAGVQVAVDASAAAVRWRDVFAKPAGMVLRVDAEAARAEGGIRITRSRLHLAEAELTAVGTVGAGGALDLQVDGAPIPLAGWERLVPAAAAYALAGTAEPHVRVQREAGAAGLPTLGGMVALAGVGVVPAAGAFRLSGLTTTAELRGDTIVVPRSSFELNGQPADAEVTVASLAEPVVTLAFHAAELPAAALGAAGTGVRKAEVLRGVEAHATARTAGGTLAVDGEVGSASGSLRDVDYQGLAVKGALRDRIATVERLHLGAFGGTYDGSGRFDLTDAARPTFDTRSTIRDMVLAELLAMQAPSAAGLIGGRLETVLTLAGAGSAWPALRRTLRGQGRVDVRDGVLKDVNLAEGVLGGVTGVPGLVMLVPPDVRRKYPDLFGTGDTRFEQLGADVHIADGRVATQNLVVAARDYSVTGHGWVDFDQRVDFTATLAASKRLTSDIVSRTREAKYVTDPQGRLAVPFRLAGRLPKVRPAPDLEFVSKAVARAAVGRGVDALVDQLGGGKKGKGKGGGKQRPEQELLRRGLDQLFGR
jgi:uncharacterized protein involved in outer membrane biogenesis